jgi:hypothetical protein
MMLFYLHFLSHLLSSFSFGKITKLCRNTCSAKAVLETKMRSFGANVLDDAQAYEAVVRAGGKSCPSCKAMIEKNEGCSHMKCACGCDFCWVCGNLLGNDIMGHYFRDGRGTSCLLFEEDEENQELHHQLFQWFNAA